MVPANVVTAMAREAKGSAVVTVPLEVMQLRLTVQFGLLRLLIRVSFLLVV